MLQKLDNMRKVKNDNYTELTFIKMGKSDDVSGVINKFKKLFVKEDHSIRGGKDNELVAQLLN